MIEIKDYHKYTELMRNGAYDKLFFIDKIFGKWETLVDFGCADGFLIRVIASLFPEKYFIGYDNNPEMIRIANENIDDIPKNLFFTHDIERVKDIDVILLSSITHEIYSYQTSEEVKSFWQFVFNKTRKYVVLRDMLESFNRENMWTDIREKAVREYCRKNAILSKIEEFENIYGTISRPNNLLHFMIKYLYINSPNWKRELNENYLALNNHILSYLGEVPKNFIFTYNEQYILPYLKHRWFKDFGIAGDVPMPLNTYGKFIFKNTNYEQ